MTATSIAPRSVAALAALILVGCGSSAGRDANQAEPGSPTTTPGQASSTPEAGSTRSGDSTDSAQQDYPDVLGADLTPSGDTWSVAATISSPYDTPARYADAFRVLAPDGTELGVRELAHDHANEQPFTRSLDGVAIPDDVEEVTIEGRDQANGWGGATVTIPVPR